MGGALAVHNIDCRHCKAAMQPARCVNSEQWAPQMPITQEALVVGLMQDGPFLQGWCSPHHKSHPARHRVGLQLTSCP